MQHSKKFEFNKKKKDFLLILFLFIFFFIFVVSIFIYIFPRFKQSSPLLLDLSGNWDLCIPNSLKKPTRESCRIWQDIKVPHSNSPNQHYKNFHWLIYEKKFNTPNQCLQQESLCSLILGEIGDAAEIKVNGNLIGLSGGFPPALKYAKNYPIKIDLPSIVLKENSTNTITIVVYSMKIPQSGIRANPIGIVDHVEATNFLKEKITFTIFFPLISAIILALFSLWSFTLPKPDSESKKVLTSYQCYCIASSLFLISFSELPREFLPLWLANHSFGIIRGSQANLALDFGRRGTR